MAEDAILVRMCCREVSPAVGTKTAAIHSSDGPHALPHNIVSHPHLPKGVNKERSQSPARPIRERCIKEKESVWTLAFILF